MQTLGLSDTTPRTESRIRALFWPRIRNDGDFDYVTEQGFWVCFVVAAVTLVLGVFKAPVIYVVLESLFYLLAGIGVRQRSKFAAVSSFAAYLFGCLVTQRYTGQGFGFIRLVVLAILLANIRGIWLSSRWAKAMTTPEVPCRLDQTFFDKLSDQMPPLVWPVAKWIFPFLAVLQVGLVLLLLTEPLPPSDMR